MFVEVQKGKCKNLITSQFKEYKREGTQDWRGNRNDLLAFILPRFPSGGYLKKKRKEKGHEFNSQMAEGEQGASEAEGQR